MIISFARNIVTKTVVAKICKLSEFKRSGVACRFPGCAVTQNKELRVVHTTAESGTVEQRVFHYELQLEQGDDVARELYILPVHDFTDCPKKKYRIKKYFIINIQNKLHKCTYYIKYS